jgi:hypothetical protein
MQRKYIFWGMVLMAGFVINGCANNRELIVNASHATRSDVFSEIPISNTISEKAIADIKFSVKRNSSYFAGAYNKYSNPPYRLNVNIDGQPMALESEPVLEDKSPIDSSIPESGTGWKYQFSKRIALAPGKHSLTIALPEDDVIVEREIVLRAGVNLITISPVYNKRMLRPYKGQSFTAGVQTVEVTVD